MPVSAYDSTAQANMVRSMFMRFLLLPPSSPCHTRACPGSLPRKKVKKGQHRDRERADRWRLRQSVWTKQTRDTKVKA